MRFMTSTAVALILGIASVQAIAQDETEDGAAAATGTEARIDDQSETAAIDHAIKVDEVIALRDFDSDDVYDGGFSIEYVMEDMAVYGRQGDEIGSVENVVFSRDGELLALIAEVGGFWDMFDTHVSVPWSEVTIDSSQRLTIPVTEENVEEFSVLKADILRGETVSEDVELVEEDFIAGQNLFRASELIGDFARIRAEDGYVDYGYVDDLIVKDGRIATVVVNSGAGYGGPGPYAYPYYRDAWRPGSPYYDMPYSSEEVIEAQRVDYSRFGRI